MANKIQEIKCTVTKLLLLLIENNNGQISHQLNQLENILDIIKSNDIDEIKESKIRSLTESIYPSRGGLTDLYIWKDDPEERIMINRPISELNDRLWNLLKN